MARSHADPEQQELLLLVAARLADGQIRRNRLRRGYRRARRRRRARRNPAAVALDPGALPDLRGRKVWDTLAIGEFLNEIAPKKALLPKDRADARPLPLDLRRDAFRLRLAAAGAADEHQGAFPALQDLVEGRGRHRAHHRDLARMPGQLRRAVPVRRNHASPTRCTPRSSAASAPMA